MKQNQLLSSSSRIFLKTKLERVKSSFLKMGRAPNFHEIDEICGKYHLEDYNNFHEEGGGCFLKRPK